MDLGESINGAHNNTACVITGAVSEMRPDLLQRVHVQDFAAVRLEQAGADLRPLRQSDWLTQARELRSRQHVDLRYLRISPRCSTEPRASKLARATLAPQT